MREALRVVTGREQGTIPQVVQAIMHPSGEILNALAPTVDELAAASRDASIPSCSERLPAGLSPAGSGSTTSSGRWIEQLRVRNVSQLFCTANAVALHWDLTLLGESPQ